MLNFLKALRRDERGVSALEYAILAAVVVVVVATGLEALDFADIFGNLNTQVNNAISGGEE